MRMNRGTLIVLAVSLVVIVGGLLLLSQPVTPPSVSTPTPGGQLPGAPLFAQVVPDTIVTLEARNNTDGTSITYSRSAAQIWSVSAGTAMQPGVEVNQSLVTQWVQGLALLSSTRILPPEGDALNTFGLTQPAYTFTLITNTGTTHRLSVGLEGPTGYYGVVDDNLAQIHIVPKPLINSVKDSILTPPYAGGTPTPMVTPTVPSELVLFPSLQADNISAITVINHQTSEFTTMSRNTLDVWNIDATTSSQQRPTDQFQSQLIASQIPTFRAEQRFNLADVGTSLADYGLDNPAYTVQITTRTGQLYTLLIGNRSSSGGYYVTYTIEAAPEATPEATAQMGPVPPEVTAEATADATAEATPAVIEVTPDTTAAPKPLPQEATPDATAEATAQAPVEATAEATAPAAEATAEATAAVVQPSVFVYVVPASTVDALLNLITDPPYLAAPEITPEATGEATSEATASADSTAEAPADATAEATTAP